MNFHNITYPDMNNGDGLRVVLWLSGCSHRCKGCQNPQTWDINSGILFDEYAKEELFRELSKDYISGITFSGGDPLHPDNSLDVENLMKEIKEKYSNKTIWLYTGSKWKNICQLPLMQYVDVCVDGEFIAELKDISLHWKGSSNQRVINVQESLKKGEVILWDTN